MTSERRTEHLVIVVDDDWRIREALAELLASHQFTALTFPGLTEYRGFERPCVPTCLVLDVELPGLSGLDYQAQIPADALPPIVFITGHGDIPSSVQAMKLGAVDFLTKPLAEAAFVRAVETALERANTSLVANARLQALRERLALLTAREREVMPLVVAGLLNKQAAGKLGISQVTFQIHRGRVMQKMGADSLAELVRMAVALDM
ncbi:MAG: hypothetical protein RL701_8031 [Pseudomonadota bacterium]